MLRDGANGSIVCDLLKQRRNRKDVTGMYLKEGFLQGGFEPGHFNLWRSRGVCVCVCVFMFAGEVWNSENEERNTFFV
jgi:hypothetical protein